MSTSDTAVSFDPFPFGVPVMSRPSGRGFWLVRALDSWRYRRRISEQLAVFEKALANIKDPDQVNPAQLYLYGFFLAEHGDLKRAGVCLGKILDKRDLDLHWRITVLQDYAAILHKLCFNDEAQQMLQEALELTRPELIHERIRVSLCLAKFALVRGKSTDALTYCIQGMRLAEEHDRLQVGHFEHVREAIWNVFFPDRHTKPAETEVVSK